MHLVPQAKTTLYTIFTLGVLVVFLYIIRGYINDETFSFAQTDWLSFAEFVGLLLAPIAGFGAAIIISLQLSYSSLVTHLNSMEKACDKVADELDRMLEVKLHDPKLGIQYNGKSIREVIEGVAERGNPSNYVVDCMLLQIRPFAKHATTVLNRLKMLHKYETLVGLEHDLSSSEHALWVARLSPILNNFHKTLGKERLKAHLKPKAYESFCELSTEFEKHR